MELQVQAKATGTGLCCCCCYTGADFSARSRGHPGAKTIYTRMKLFVSSVSFSFLSLMDLSCPVIEQSTDSFVVYVSCSV
jgi:hypothetical protein